MWRCGNKDIEVGEYDMSKQAGLSTSDVANRVFEKEPEKLEHELKARQKELGLDAMKPIHGQNVLQQLDDIKNEKNNIIDVMQQEKEKRLKKTAEEKKAKQKTPKQKLQMILMYEERKAREAYDSRRMVFLDGGFDKYEETVKMMPYRVLLKEIKTGEQNADGIIVPETHTERYPHYTVLAVGEDCDGIEKGMTVIVEAYAGTEIVSAKDIYRIVTCDDILGEVQNG